MVFSAVRPGDRIGVLVAPPVTMRDPNLEYLRFDPVPAIMNHRTSTLSCILLVVLAACGQMPSTRSDGDASGPRYVDVEALTSGDAYSDVQVLTSVVLQHISAVDAEARLQANLPEGVRVSRVGATQKILLQGRGQAVTESVHELGKIDVR